MWPTRMARATLRISGNTHGAVNSSRKRAGDQREDAGCRGIMRITTGIVRLVCLPVKVRPVWRPRATHLVSTVITWR